MRTELHTNPFRHPGEGAGQPDAEELRFPGEYPPKILVVDDNMTYRLVLCALLQQMGAETEQAVCGEDAVNKAAQQEFDVILMDIGLPDMDGYEAAKKIQANAHSPVPIVTCTAYDGQEEREAAKAAGMSGFVTKPAGRNKLFMAILERLAKKSDAGLGEDGQEKIERVEPGVEVVLDSDGLQTMLSELSEASRSLVLASVPRDAKASLSLMTVAAMNSDLEKLETASHQLKGLARTFGAKRLAALAEQLGFHAKAGLAKEALSCVPDVQVCTRETLEAIAQQTAA